jgi:cytochrome c oxidase subunit 2
MEPEEFAAWLEEKQAPAEDAAGAEGEGGADGAALFAEGNGDSTACAACHTLADAGSSSNTGPDLDEVLPGQEPDQIRTSIVDPTAAITEGFMEGIMPSNYGSTLSDEELDALVEYLAEVTSEEAG